MRTRASCQHWYIARTGAAPVEDEFEGRRVDPLDRLLLDQLLVGEHSRRECFPERDLLQGKINPVSGVDFMPEGCYVISIIEHPLRRGIHR